jgi:hypothetical protein
VEVGPVARELYQAFRERIDVECGRRVERAG